MKFPVFDYIFDFQIIFMNIGKVIFHTVPKISERQAAFYGAMVTMSTRRILKSLSIWSSSSPHVSGYMRNLYLDKANISQVIVNIASIFKAKDTKIGLLSVESNDIELENVNITVLEKLHAIKSSTIKNSYIGYINVSAILADFNSQFNLENVTIGKMHRESLIILNKFNFNNVFVNSIEDGGIILKSVESNSMYNVTINHGSHSSIINLAYHKFTLSNVSINGKLISMPTGISVINSYRGLQIGSHKSDYEAHGNAAVGAIAFVSGVVVTLVILCGSFIYWR